MTKTARLETRITPDLQALLKRAAELEGRSVTDFVVTAAQAAAEKSVEQAQVVRASRSKINAPSSKPSSIRQNPLRRFAALSSVIAS